MASKQTTPATLTGNKSRLSQCWPNDRDKDSFGDKSLIVTPESHKCLHWVETDAVSTDFTSGDGLGSVVATQFVSCCSIVSYSVGFSPSVCLILFLLIFSQSVFCGTSQYQFKVIYFLISVETLNRLVFFLVTEYVSLFHHLSKCYFVYFFFFF